MSVVKGEASVVVLQCYFFSCLPSSIMDTYAVTTLLIVMFLFKIENRSRSYKTLFHAQLN